MRSELERLKALVKASRLINSTLDIAELMEIIRSKGIAELQAERATIYLVDDKRRELRSAYIDKKTPEIVLRFGIGIAGVVAETGKSRLVGDAQSDPDFYQEIDKKTGFKTRSILCSPMKSNSGKLTGVFEVLSSQKDKFNIDDLKFLDSLSDEAALAIEKARLFSETIKKNKLELELAIAKRVEKELLDKMESLNEAEEEIEHLKSIIQATWLMNSTLNLDHLMELIRRAAREALKAKRATIYLADDEEQRIHSVYIEDRNIDIDLPYGVGIAGTVAKSRNTINIKDAQKDSRFYDEIDKQTSFVTRSVLCVPLLNKEERLIGVFQALNSEKDEFSSSDQRYLEDLAVQAALAIENAQLYSEALEKRKMEEELDIARDIQKRLLPQEILEIQGYDIAAVNIPAKQVGGDYYDFFLTEKGDVRFAIGDVSGKGISAALLMAMIQANFRAIGGKNTPANTIASKMNNSAFNCTSLSKFITFFCGLLRTKSGRITYCNAGHDPPIHYSPGKDACNFEKGGIPLGFVEEFEYVESSATLAEGDILTLYSDGVIEAMDNRELEFGCERLQEVIAGSSDRPSKEIIENVIQSLSDYTQSEHYEDDVTLLILKRNR